MNISLIWRLVQNAGQELLLAAGADKAVVMQTEGNPVVYGGKRWFLLRRRPFWSIRTMT